jgi:hypothetical protein
MPRRNLLIAGAATAGAVGLGTFLSSSASAAPQPLARQHEWRWCNYCQCLFYEKDYTSGCCSRRCGHNWRGSGNYYLTYGGGSGQPDWCWCNKCENVWWGGSNNWGKCASGGGHTKDGSGNYYIDYGTPQHGEQPGWKWCNKCYCLCYSGQGYGHCAGNGGHNFGGSGNYYLAYG